MPSAQDLHAVELGEPISSSAALSVARHGGVKGGQGAVTAGDNY